VRRLVFVVTEDWYFVSHRLPMARAAAAAGWHVGVATRVDRHGEAIRAEGFDLHPLAWRRSARGPFAALAQIRVLFDLFRLQRPALVHLVALKPVVLGGIAARLAGVPAAVHSLTGLGTAFIARGVAARLRRTVLLALMRWIFAPPCVAVIVQNRDDRALLATDRLVPEARVRTIRGSGVDIDRFTPLPEPAEGPVTVAYVGRMLRDKGVHLVVEAQQALRASGRNVALLLAGTPDPENPTSFDEATVRGWAGLPGVDWLGHVDDVRAVMARCHVVVLMSAREGLPKSLLEAMACGRPVVASDVPGCTEVTRDDTGILVPPGDVAGLIDAFARLADDADLRRRLGAGGRRLVEAEMSSVAVGAQTVAVYRDLTGG
jgi:glycosyltransferase involved in cell wall biosynthesis